MNITNTKENITSAINDDNPLDKEDACKKLFTE
jgi:hypothetical protein